MIPNEKRPVSVEDLLQLKRAERPAPEFWERFDRELRAKQLAALVGKRPWWRDLPSRFAGFRRYHLPLGATAALAITFVTVRDYEPAGIERTASRVVAAQVNTATSNGHGEYAPPMRDPGTPRAAGHERDTGTSDDAWHAVDTREALDSAPDTGVAAGRIPPDISLILASGTVAETQLTPSARSIAANLAAAEAVEPAVVRRLLGLSHSFEAGHSGIRTAIEPLQQMTSPAEVRLARFDSPMARTSSLETPSRKDDRVARDIDVYERAARRIGGGGDRLTVKF
jgi:hypothetical protein